MVRQVIITMEESSKVKGWAGYVQEAFSPVTPANCAALAAVGPLTVDVTLRMEPPLPLRPLLLDWPPPLEMRLVKVSNESMELNSYNESSFDQLYWIAIKGRWRENMLIDD